METKIKTKVLNFLQDLVRKRSFIESILILRKKYKIPENGFDLKRDYTGNNLPKQLQSSDKKKDDNLYDEILQDIQKTIEDQHYKDKISLGCIIAEHLFYNDMFYFIEKSNFEELGLIKMFDLDTFYYKDGKELQIRNDLPDNTPFFSDHNNYKYCILINSEATKNNVVDFITKKYKQIEISKKKITPSLPKNIFKNRTRRPKDLKKADLIYEHKDKKTSEILKILRENKITSENSEVRKIISIEKRRREK